MKQRETKVLSQWKVDELKKQKELNKKPFYLKKETNKNLLLKDKFKDLKEKKQLNKYMETKT